MSDFSDSLGLSAYHKRTASAQVLVPRQGWTRARHGQDGKGISSLDRRRRCHRFQAMRWPGRMETMRISGRWHQISRTALCLCNGHRVRW